jgi:hypothetical protein
MIAERKRITVAAKARRVNDPNLCGIWVLPEHFFNAGVATALKRQIYASEIPFHLHNGGLA